MDVVDDDDGDGDGEGDRDGDRDGGRDSDTQNVPPTSSKSHSCDVISSAGPTLNAARGSGGTYIISN